MTAPPVAPRYRVVLPPGFLLLPVQDATDDEIAQTVRDHYRALPRDTYGPRIDRVAAQLVASAHLARDARVLDLILPMGVPNVARISCRCVIPPSWKLRGEFTMRVAHAHIHSKGTA